MLTPVEGVGSPKSVDERISCKRLRASAALVGVEQLKYFTCNS
jgi:hypothetical protein